MLHESTRLLTRDGYVQLGNAVSTSHTPSIEHPHVQRVPYVGEVLYIYSEQGDAPLVCTPNLMILAKGEGFAPSWTRACDIGRGCYIGVPIPATVEGFSATDILTKQLACISSGVCRAVRSTSLDDESAPGDAVFDKNVCWFRVHDIETTNEPAQFVYKVSRCIASNIHCADFFTN